MQPMKSLIVICVFTLSLFSTCSKDDEFKPWLKGDIIGYACCFDEFGDNLEDYSGIQVYTEPGRKYHAETDPDGRYVLKDVINGTYDLSFEKEGFGTMKLQGVEHLGGNPTVIDYYYGGHTPFIYQKSTGLINYMKLENDTLNIKVTYPGQVYPANLYTRILFSTSQNFDIGSSVVKNVVLFNYGDVYRKSVSSEIENLPFEPGETVYYKAGIYTSRYAIMLFNYYYISGIDTYYDFNTNTTIYPNLSDESEEFSFSMP
jgi:hypothetical protein